MSIEAKKAHAKFSASGSKRWLMCPGSIALSEKAPPQAESRYAKEGTDGHTVVEYLTKNRKKRLAAAAFLRETYPIQMVTHAETTLNYIEKRLKEFPGAELLVEVRCDLPVSEPGQFGTTDLAIVDHFGRLIVIDYKYGAGVIVDVEENPQMLYYALGLAHQYDYNFSEVELVVVQPRAPIEGKTIRSWLTTVDKLIEWRDKFENGIKACKKPDAPLLSGAHCQFCPAKIICPEIKNKALRQAQADFDDETGEITLPAVVENSFSQPTKITAEYLSRALPALEKLEVWIGAVRETATQLLEEGTKIKGYALVETRPQRKWADYDYAAKEAAKEIGAKAFTRPELLSPAQFEKLGAKAKAFAEKNTISVSSGVKLGRDKAAEDFKEKEVETDDLKKKKKASRKS